MTHHQAEVQIPLSSILEAHSLFENDLYGYLLVLLGCWDEGTLEEWSLVYSHYPNHLDGMDTNVILLKEDLCSVLVWVKFQDIPIVAFTKDGFSVMTNCLDVRAYRTPKETMVIVIPSLEGNGDVMHMVIVEYEWKSHRCESCMLFGHEDDICPKHVTTDVHKQSLKSNDGFYNTLRKASRGIHPNYGAKV
ncbi:hypothetical protein Tco_0578384 [Tanacetum coccineum]